MARNGANFAELEQAARTAIEQQHGHGLKDEKWRKQRNRLIEFARTLARWDSEQRHRAATSESKEGRLAS
jgi:hypothetical protein